MAQAVFFTCFACDCPALFFALRHCAACLPCRSWSSFYGCSNMKDLEEAMNLEADVDAHELLRRCRLVSQACVALVSLCIFQFSYGLPQRGSFTHSVPRAKRASLAVLCCLRCDVTLWILHVSESIMLPQRTQFNPVVSSHATVLGHVLGTPR